MNATAEDHLIEAARSLEEALASLERHAGGGAPSLVGDAFGDLLKVRGELAALRQMFDIRAIGAAPTERAPALKLVRP